MVLRPQGVRRISASVRRVPVGPSVQLGLPEMIARGLIEKGESLGINKTVMNAVSELRVSDSACHRLPKCNY